MLLLTQLLSNGQAKYLNCGQVCVAPDYVLVHRDVADALLAKFKSLVKTWYGSDVKRSKDFGRIINQRHHDRICGLLEDHGGEVRGILLYCWRHPYLTAILSLCRSSCLVITTAMIVSFIQPSSKTRTLTPG